ncbi:hypothetical protein MPSEU_000575600 [Mayamaea pseudoterrestris]|nr:hypothetical protein MPSEU_000575600 [Mayamaea pseudoterrestris]
MTSLSSANAKPDAFTDAENRRMSLFNRYATLGDEASAMRKRRKALEEEMEAIQNKQVALDHEQVRLGRAAQAAQASTETFHGKIRKLQTEHQQVKDAMDEVTIARDAVRRRRDNMQSEGRLERIRFLELSREFRASCKRLRASALACGLEQASMQAYLETNGVDIHSHDHVDDDKVMLDDDDLDDDPATWKIESNDKELAKRLEIYTNKKQFNDEASDKVQRAEAAKQVIWKQLQSRQAQEDNLQGQAERIAKDNADLEQQIEEMQRLTRDVEQKKAKMLRQRTYHVQKFKYTCFVREVVPPCQCVFPSLNVIFLDRIHYEPLRTKEEFIRDALSCDDGALG